jgi:hypothetical protein
MKKIITALTAVIVFLGTTGFAQDAKPIEIFGFFQSKFSYIPEYDFAKSQNSFNIQQMNILFRKDLGQDFSAFVNLQILNSFNTEQMWGSMNLEEAWVKYEPTEEFSIKGGLLIPAFNNLNEIKSKTPLLPYIFRPFIYESSMSFIINTGDFAPERAFMQIGGTKTFDLLKLDYAAYIGNSESAYLTSTNLGATPAGQDTTTFKMIGGRVGIRTGNIKAGVSATYDRKKSIKEVYTGIVVPMNNAPRVRIGGDLSFKIANLSFEGELVYVNISPDDLAKAGLKYTVMMTTNPYTGVGPFNNGWNEKFFYANLMYDINDQWFVYGGGNYLQNDFETVYKDGLNLLTFGGGFRPIDQVVVKAQFAQVRAKNEELTKMDFKIYNLAISVLF